MPNLIFEYSLWWFLLAIAIALGLVLWQYFTQTKFSVKQRRWLASLRFLALLIIGFLLLGPQLNLTTTRNEKPVLLWLQDDSESMLLASDSAAVKDFTRTKSEQWQNKLSEKYAIQKFYFAEEPSKEKQNFKGGTSNLAKALQEASGRYYGKNIGAAVLISDGIYNLGGNPKYTAQNLTFPVYALGVGDTTTQKDLALQKLVYNSQTYQGAAFPLKVPISAKQLQGQTFTVSVGGEEGLIHQKTVKVNSPDFYTAPVFYINPKEPGLKRYRVKLSALPGEENIANNQSSFVIEVVNQQKKIVLIGQSPHPDLAAIQSALSQKKAYNVKVLLSSAITTAPPADLYILHEPTRNLLEILPLEKTPGLVLAGPQTNYPALQRSFGVSLAGKADNEEVYPVFNEGFTMFQLNEKERVFLKDVPPLLAPYGQVKAKLKITPLFFKKIGKVATQQPLFFVAETEKSRQAISFGQNFWRWRFYNYKSQGNFEAFDGIWQKLVQYLTTKNLKKRFDVSVGARFTSRQAINFNARLLNPSLELTNKPAVQLKLINTKNEVYAYTLSREQKAYTITLEALPADVYKYEANVQLGTERFVAKGEFVVEDLNYEKQNTKANHKVLRNIAVESGGNFFNLTQQNRLLPLIESNQNAKVETYSENQIERLLRFGAILALLIFLFSAEWGLRKYWGNY
jgi:hypothetical protein